MCHFGAPYVVGSGVDVCSVIAGKVSIASVNVSYNMFEIETVEVA